MLVHTSSSVASAHAQVINCSLSHTHTNAWNINMNCYIFGCVLVSHDLKKSCHDLCVLLCLCVRLFLFACVFVCMTGCLSACVWERWWRVWIFKNKNHIYTPLRSWCYIMSPWQSKYKHLLQVLTEFSAFCILYFVYSRLRTASVDLVWEMIWTHWSTFYLLWRYISFLSFLDEKPCPPPTLMMLPVTRPPFLLSAHIFSRQRSAFTCRITVPGTNRSWHPMVDYHAAHNKSEKICVLMNII